MLAMFRAQPRPFYMIFMLEIWERFGFYTMQGILVLYFIRFLNTNDSTAYYTFGAFFALVYGIVPLGGYLGDHILGTKRTIVLGLVTLMLGYLSLALADKAHVFYALGLICVGNGLFKANPANLLSKCYEERDPRLHAGFTLYYMSINLGAIFALLIGPNVASKYGYSYAFFISSIGILLGLLNYGWQRGRLSNINTLADRRNIAVWHWIVIVMGILLLTYLSALLLQHTKIAKQLMIVVICIIVGIYFISIYRESKEARLRMVVAFVLMLEAVAFFTLYHQMPTSINLFAVHNVDPYLFGFHLDPQSLQVLNPLWITVLSPILAALYAKLYREGISFPIPYKFAAGMTCCGISFIILYFARYWHDTHGIVSFWWLVLSYFSQTLSELLVSALGVAMVAELVPPRMAGFVMGVWFLTSSVAGFTGAAVATYTALPVNVQPGMDSLYIYTHAFAYIGGITLLLAIFLWSISPWLKKLML